MNSLIILVLLCGCGYANRYLGLPNDNPIEKSVEEVIEKETGARVDFTPEKADESK